jgi:hypothetical protein
MILGLMTGRQMSSDGVQVAGLPEKNKKLREIEYFAERLRN